MEKKSLTYKDAGVDIRAGDAFVEKISPIVKQTFGPEVLTGIGGFGGLFSLNLKSYQNPVLVSGTDGVGTKLKLAFLTGRHATVGIDLVAMCVNDIVVSGAQPLFFLDYLATGKLRMEESTDVVRGIAEGCRQAGCALIGGETAEMPDFYSSGEYDLAGFVVGIVERSRIIDGSQIRSGDVVIGIASSGLHSNGYSLVRKIVLEEEGRDLNERIPPFKRSLGEVLMEPTRIYSASLLALVEKTEIKGMAHITGGGIPGNVQRILPAGCAATIRRKSWRVPPVFPFLAERGRVSDEEMFGTFNMGIGMALVVAASEADGVMAELARKKEDAWIIGEISDGRREVILQ